MKKILNAVFLFLVIFFAPVDTSAAMHHLGGAVIVLPANGASSIQKAIDTLPLEGGTIRIHAGEYTLQQGIHIKRSNVTVIGDSGTTLKLADHVNEPVLLIGADVESPEAKDEISNIRIYDIEIDGNKDNQDSETDPDRVWIYNNGIDVRRVRNLWISNVHVHHAVSGGLVVSWASSNIFVSKSIFHSNVFDGIALYASEDIEISDFICYNNQASGLSLDNDLKNVIFHSGAVRNNLDNGIFARHCKDLSFHDLFIFKNNSHGCFISHDSPGTGTGVTRLFFSSCSFIENGLDGFHLGSTTADSTNNAVAGCLFSGNIGNALYVIPGGLIDESGNIYQ